MAGQTHSGPDSTGAHELRWGLVGAGAMAATMGADIAATPGNRVVACASRTARRSSAIAATFSARAEATLEALLAASDVDIVYIATPPATHVDLAVAALQAGKHVLLEKPFTTTAAEAVRVAETARAVGRFCMEAMWTRFVGGDRGGSLRQVW
jgi:predicted dehydrogenase